MLWQMAQLRWIPFSRGWGAFNGCEYAVVQTGWSIP
jgi:hypothetical protein